MATSKVKIKKGDRVIVRVGSHKGKIGDVLSVCRENQTVTVEGVNVVTRHKKPTSFSEGGPQQITKPIHISNVAFYDAESGIFSKITYKTDKSGEKKRVLKKTSKVLQG